MIRIALIALLIGGAAYAEDDDVIRSESTVTSNGSMETTIVSPHLLQYPHKLAQATLTYVL